MPIARPPLPLADYQRIFRVLKAVIDEAGADTAHACILYSVAGAALVEQIYKKRCQPVAGAAFYALDDSARTILSFCDQEERHNNLSSAKGFHCWILCEGYIIDFMAPVFRESLHAIGVKENCSRKMFQKPLESMADSRLLMRTPGDFFLLPNVELTRQILEEFHSHEANNELLKLCVQWYKKPPRSMPSQISIQNNTGLTSMLNLSDLSLTGVW